MKVGNFVFELKNFQYIESRSEETICFGAVLYVNGIKFADCGNGGHGGPTDINVYPKCLPMNKDVETFLKTQPKIKIENIELDFDLEYIVDCLVTTAIEGKILQKMKRKTLKYLVFKDKSRYYWMGWKGYSIDTTLSSLNGRNLIKQTIAKELSKGSILINDNISSELLP